MKTCGATCVGAADARRASSAFLIETSIVSPQCLHFFAFADICSSQNGQFTKLAGTAFALVANVGTSSFSGTTVTSFIDLPLYPIPLLDTPPPRRAVKVATMHWVLNPPCAARVWCFSSLCAAGRGQNKAPPLTYAPPPLNKASKSRAPLTTCKTSIRCANTT
jgi:hypothetical protein